MPTDIPPFASDAQSEDDVDEGLLDTEARAEALRTHRAIVATIEALGDELEHARGEDADEIAERLDLYLERESDLRQIYVESLQPVAISRCPFSGAFFRRSIDTVDLDGLWWRADAAVRPREPAPPTFVALSGAMRLGSPVASAPFVAKPGPAVPFVIPRLLAGGAKAVLSTVRVGPHTGYAVAYFHERPISATPRVNEWGGDGHELVDEDGDWSWEDDPEDPAERDFALRPWLAGGSLLWVAPDDASLTIRSGVAGCPYLDLTGAHETQRVEEGAVR